MFLFIDNSEHKPQTPPPQKKTPTYFNHVRCHPMIANIITTKKKPDLFCWLMLTNVFFVEVEVEDIAGLAMINRVKVINMF